MIEKDYLGDSVYIEFNGYAIVLTTENGPEGPSNKIYMEPEVIEAMMRFLDRLKEAQKQPSITISNNLYRDANGQIKSAGQTITETP